nr:hypothetical protein [Psychrobacter sp. PraFG1]UNK05814.1 hypothetical protein MN210_03245 [Psychrobacter sp. PraFG1]
MAFGDKATGREHDKARKQYVKANKAMAKAQQAMGIKELAELMPEAEEDIAPMPSITEIMVADGNTMRKQTVEAEADSANEFDDDFVRAMAMITKERNDE